MTPRTTATPVPRPRATGLTRNAGRTLSDRIHAAADDHARAQGWEVTETRGRFGLRGRTYRDPRFNARRHDLAAGRSVRQ